MLAISILIQYWFFSVNVLILSLSSSIGLPHHGLSFSEKSPGQIFSNHFETYNVSIRSVTAPSAYSAHFFFFFHFSCISTFLEIIKHNMPKCCFFLSSSIIKWLHWMQQCMHKTFERGCHYLHSPQFSLSVSECLTLCNPLDCSMPGFHVHHQLPELTQTHVNQVGDTIQPSHPLSSPSPAFNPYSLYRFFILQLLHQYMWLSSLHLPLNGLNNRGGTQPCPSTEIGLKFTEHGPTHQNNTHFSLSQCLPLGKFISLLSLSIRGQTEGKPQS